VGKTTLGKLLAGILKPARGQVLLFGENTRDMPLYLMGRKIGYSFQNPDQQLFASSVAEEIGFGLKYRGANLEHISRVTAYLLNLFDIEHLKEAFPLNLSWGEKRRVVLAACLAQNPEYLILDEPTTGLDEERIKALTEIIASLRRKGTGILLISHHQTFIEQNAERILRMEGGEIRDDRFF
jgi:energy-coupling factor transport system ATP-binding protein